MYKFKKIKNYYIYTFDFIIIKLEYTYLFAKILNRA